MSEPSYQQYGCLKLMGGPDWEGNHRIDFYTLLELKGLITGLEATGAATVVSQLKRLHNRCVYLEAQEQERKESK